ncbi:site-specific integrase [Pseudonocardia eucalypti]|uniref:Site-specific integrase n=1 Tax=Pseudonocardia eucalypti TaxID=648755 RepID=A0ABP9RFD9_9PSEU|nr:integrase [Pseudonocardia eucalypti]MBB6380777.1 integrase [Pseudonocardia eucalypti]
MAVDDLWYLKKRDPKTKKKLPSKRHGRGMRWRVRYIDPSGEPKTQLCEKKSEADDLDAEMRSDVLRGTYLDQELSKKTVKEFGTEWHAARVFKRQNTEDATERGLRLHVYPTLGKYKLHEMRRTRIQEWIKGLDHLAPGTVHNLYSYVSMLFESAVLDKAIGSSPCVKIDLPEIKYDDRVILRADQVHGLAKAMFEKLRASIYVGSGCGTRFGETMGLELEHVDFLHREITVSQQVIRHRGKGLVLGPLKTTSSYRTVEMPAATMKALAAHIKKFPPREIEVMDMTDPRKPHVRTAKMIFPSTTGKLMSGTVYGFHWKKAAKAAGLPEDSHFHLLRHYFATTLIFGGANVKTVQLALGHSKPSITLDTYTGLWPDDTQERTRHLMDAGFAGVINPRGEITAKAS